MAERGAAVISGLAAYSALGRSVAAQLDRALQGAAGFGPVQRFDVSRRRVSVAATAPDLVDLRGELISVVDQACQDARLTATQRAACPLLLAAHGEPGLAELAAAVAAGTGLPGPEQIYTTACVSASTAVADAAGRLVRGEAERVVVAAGYLVEPDQFALFDAGRALATDGAARPFSAGRSGLLLGDGVAAVVLESAAGARLRGCQPYAEIVGWGRAGDAYHPCQPDPQGRGLARAIESALRRAGLRPEEIGHINANATGAELGDASEAAAIRRAFGPLAGRIPVSSTKSVHGHALEASALLELVLAVLALRHGKLPVNAGFLNPDEACPLDVITPAPRTVATPYALSLNAAFGGANTALLVRAA
ncbi:MAG: beta-ketoacyl-[acyl-carrier-protein] synthase family protein [Micromonosporaceae bacterium]